MMLAIVEATALTVLVNLAKHVLQTTKRDTVYPGNLGARSNVEYAVELSERELKRLEAINRFSAVSGPLDQIEGNKDDGRQRVNHDSRRDAD